VDAQVAASKAWDLYQMFGRNGPDGLGTSVGVIVNELNWQTGRPLEGAFFNNSYLILGDHADPAHPTELMSFAEADVVGHEMSHGVVQSTQLNGPNFGNESLGIAEAFCGDGRGHEALL
jgi:Zn-dependent metalloprotease